jgi:Protein of unknown function (DUF2695)
VSGRVLTPDPFSPEWRCFIEDLWQHLPCQGDCRVAARLLQLGGYDVERSLALYRSRGGCCDCEIRFNLGAEGAEP